MQMLVSDPQLQEQLIEQRRETGLDRYDEVWEGAYIILPFPNDEHQDIALGIGSLLREVIQLPGLGQARPNVNVADRLDDWRQNFRGPDAAVFLNDTAAVLHGTVWVGGPDFAVEITSPGDRTRDKLGFYATVGTRELLIIDREPWSLELHRLDGEAMKRVGRCEPGDETALRSDVVPLTWQLESGDARPTILVTHHNGGTDWRV